MNETNAVRLIECLGVQEAELHGDWIVASCPFAFTRHRSGKDSSPSFGIAHNPTGRSGYNCFSCNVKSKDVSDIILEMQFALTKGKPEGTINLAEALKIVEQENEIGYFSTEWTGKVYSVAHKFEPWPDWWLSSFYPVFQFPQAMAYLNSRGVEPWVWKALDIRFDSHKKTVCFPIRNRAGKLSGLRGRFLDPIGDFRHYDYKWNKINNTALVWMNEHKVDFLKPVVVVEGQFDVANVYHVYQNVLGNLSTGLSEQKVKKLETAIEVIGFFDDDPAGRAASEILQRRLKGSYRPVTYPEHDPEVKLDPGKLSKQEIRDVLSPFVAV